MGIRTFARKIRFYFRLFTCPYFHISYSQVGEDILIENALDRLGILHPTYLDIGANDPIRYSNTYFLYMRKCYGVCVEPDPHLFTNFKRKRKRDRCLNIGIGDKNAPSAEFYLMSDPALNTFSPSAAAEAVKYGNRILKKVNIPIMDINSLIEQNFPDCPDLLSIDIEGLDLTVLQSLDYNRFRPKIICAETSTYSSNGKECFRIQEIVSFMSSMNYFTFADTYLNTIFIDKNCWNPDKPQTMEYVEAS